MSAEYTKKTTAINQNVLKGFLICLVVLDHNEYAHKLFPQFLAGFSFHVVGFLALPFLRPPELFGKRLLEKAFVSYYYPYSLILCGMACITMLESKHISVKNILDILLALYSGNSSIVKSVSQMSLLWFLPSFISLLLVRSFMAEINKNIQFIFIFFLIISHVLIGDLGGLVVDYLPLGLLPTIYAFPLILLIVLVHRCVFEKIERFNAIFTSCIAFVIVKYFQIHMGLNQELGFIQVSDYRDMSAMLVNDMEAVVGTLMLFQLSRINFGVMIERVGRNSMQVYLIHAFVALAIYKILETNLSNVAMSLRLVISMLLTVVGSGLIAQLIMNSELLRRLLFPRSWSQLMIYKKGAH